MQDCQQHGIFDAHVLWLPFKPGTFAIGYNDVEQELEKGKRAEQTLLSATLLPGKGPETQLEVEGPCVIAFEYMQKRQKL